MKVHYSAPSVGLTSDPEFEAIRAFMDKFGILTNTTPVHLKPKLILDRLQLMTEELCEFAIAADDHDLAGMADALVDLVYVVKGTAVQLGLPWAELMNDVHDANMSKEPGVNTKRGNQHVDVIKPTGWVGPQTETILKAAGYVRGRFFEDGVIYQPALVGYPE